MIAVSLEMSDEPFIHIIPTPIIRSHRGLTNVQAISKAYSTEKSLLPYHVKVVYQYR